MKYMLRSKFVKYAPDQKIFVIEHPLSLKTGYFRILMNTERKDSVLWSIEIHRCVD